MVGTKVGPIIAAIMMAHMMNKRNNSLGIIDMGAVAILYITHHAHKTMAKKVSQKTFRKMVCCILYSPFEMMGGFMCDKSSSTTH